MHIQAINTVKKEMAKQVTTKEIILRVNKMRCLIMKQAYKSPDLNLY